MGDPLTLRILRFLPRNVLSRAVGWLAARRRPRFLVRRLTASFARRYGVAVDEAEQPIAEYSSLLEFFTRRLHPDAREVNREPDALVSPVDGTVGSLGRIVDGTLVQAKGMTYGLVALLGHQEAAAAFADGWFATLYLSPKDYHRIHAPAAGAVQRSLHEPGTLWPVNPPAVARLPSLFATNERITAVLDTDAGPVAVAMVGATNVGSIRLAYDSYVTNRPGRRRQTLDHQPAPQLERGQELAVFELGSTVIVLVSRADFAWAVREGDWIPMGSLLGRFG